MGWTHPHGCLDAIEVGWIGSAKEYSSNMRVRPIPRKTTDGANLLQRTHFSRRPMTETDGDCDDGRWRMRGSGGRAPAHRRRAVEAGLRRAGGGSEAGRRRMSSVADPARMSGRGGRGRPPEESGAAEEGGAGRARSRADPATPSSVARGSGDELGRAVRRRRVAEEGGGGRQRRAGRRRRAGLPVEEGDAASVVDGGGRRWTKEEEEGASVPLTCGPAGGRRWRSQRREHGPPSLFSISSTKQRIGFNPTS